MPQLTLLPSNLKYLRHSKGLSQSDMLTQLDVKRTTWNGYETGSSQPYLDVLLRIAEYFDVSIDKLLFSDLTKGNLTSFEMDREKGNRIGNGNSNLKPVKAEFKEAESLELSEDEAPLRSEPKRTHFMPRVITVDSAGNENAVYVPVKARAGYLLGYGDEQFIEKLPAYRLPGLSNGTFRIFEVDGLSMFNTLQDKDRVIGRWTAISEIRNDRVHVLVTKNDGLVIKRVLNRLEEGKIVCKSDNNHKGEYPTIVLDIHEILEAWYVVERWTKQLPSPGEIYKRIVDLEADMAIIKQNLLKG